MANYVLPPPLGVSNDLYEAYPQPADTLFNTPKDYTPLRPLPALPSRFAPSATSPGNVVTSTGSAISENSTATIPRITVTPANPMMPDVGGIGASIGDYFLRAVIIILGFIFVAVGLRSLAPNIVNAVTK